MPSRGRPFGRKAWFPQPGKVWDSGCSLKSPTNPRSVSPGWGSGLISWARPGLGGLRGSGQQGSSRHSRGLAALGRRLALLVGLAATWGCGAGAGRRAVFPLLGIPGAPDPRPGQALGELDRRSRALSAGPRHGALRMRGGERAVRRRWVFVSEPGAAIASSAPGCCGAGCSVAAGRDARFPAENRQLLLDGGRHRRAAGRAKHSAYTQRWGPWPQPTSRLITLEPLVPPCPRRAERGGGSGTRFPHGSGAYNPLLLSG